jgi:lysophospholipase L1-like esterase
MISRRHFLRNSLSIGPVLAFPDLAFKMLGKKLPKVLIIGDSISIGYFPFVKELMNGKAEVTRPFKENGNSENCQGTSNGVMNIHRWIGDTEWDIIHFNFGLHDMKHVNPVTRENSSNPEHPLQADLKQYKHNLQVIVEALKRTGAKLIFATTTPYPDEVGGPLRDPGMPEKYNKAAMKIMKNNGITVNDLFTFVIPRMNEWQRPNNVHFTEKGSQMLAEQVTKAINSQL